MTDSAYIPIDGKIYIETHAAFLHEDENPFDHLYITWTDMSGVERVFRGGFYNGDLTSEVGTILALTDDARKDKNGDDQPDTPEDRHQTELD